MKRKVGKIPRKEQKLAELRAKRAVCQAALRIIENEVDDPRQPAALNAYNDQLAEIDRLITVITGTPPPVIIGLKVATLSGRTQ